MSKEPSELRVFTLTDLAETDSVQVGLEQVLKDNVWRYDKEDHAVVYSPAGKDSPEDYDILLDGMTTSAAVLDWIAQISRKNWATPRVVGDLVRLLDVLLDLQANYCSFGREQNSSPRNVTQLLSRRFG